MNLSQCLEIMREEVKDKYVICYIEALDEVVNNDGMYGLVVQMKYIKENIKSWRSGSSKKVKTFISNWIKEKELDLKK